LQDSNGLIFLSSIFVVLGFVDKDKVLASANLFTYQRINETR